MNIHDLGLYRIAAAVPSCAVGRCAENSDAIIALLKKASEEGADIAVFPALSVTSASCGDLFAQRVLLAAAEEQMQRIIRETAPLPVIGIAGLPFLFAGRIYSVAAVFSRGVLYGIAPLDGTEQSRVFSRYTGVQQEVYINDLQGGVPFGSGLVFKIADSGVTFTVGDSCGSGSGAALQIEPLARASYTGSFTDLCRSAAVRSKEQRIGLVFVNAGWGESTTDTVCAGERGIYENGELLAASSCFELQAVMNGSIDGYTGGVCMTVADIDCEAPRQTARALPEPDRCIEIPAVPSRGHFLIRPRNPLPFIPLAVQNNETAREAFFSQAAELQARGLAKRLQHTGAVKTVIGISGGADSTLALLIAVIAARMIGQSAASVTAVTIPGFGTTGRTKTNALQLAETLGCTVLTIPLEKAVLQHFADIGHPTGLHDTVYENAQARERTQILMDKANQLGALLVGTGDLSEAALGWETYNGDHMSMYNVNAGIPKTVLRQCLRYFAEHPAVCIADVQHHQRFCSIIQDIIDTPISPELLPAQGQVILQKTEDIVGPYELHDFFLYYLLHTDFSPEKILLFAEHTFCSQSGAAYDRKAILTYLTYFYRRVFSQQFKRSCSPDGPYAGFGSFSPRGAWRMPSDMCADVWLSQLAKLS